VAESVPSTDTFDALTEYYTPEVLVDNVFSGTPVWEMARRNMEPVSGKGYMPIIMYDAEGGEWYEKGDQVGQGSDGLRPGVSGDIATRALFKHQFYRNPVRLNAQDTDLQGPLAIVDLMKTYIENKTDSTRVDLSTKLFIGEGEAASPNEIQGLCPGCSDGAWGGLDPDADNIPVWKAHIMDGEDTYETPVAPSLDNISKMIRTITNTCGESKVPDLIVVAEEYWDVLYGQLTRNEYNNARVANGDNPIIQWGFSAIFVNGVPIVSDRDCPGEAWVSSQSTRVAAKGYQAFFLNWEHLTLYYAPARSFKWDPDGWRRPTDYDQYLNYFYFWGGIGGDHRRTLGRMYNVCLDPSELPMADWHLGEVDIPEVTIESASV
jgi:hypothetical protein